MLSGQNYHILQSRQQKFFSNFKPIPASIKGKAILLLALDSLSFVRRAPIFGSKQTPTDRSLCLSLAVAIDLGKPNANKIGLFWRAILAAAVDAAGAGFSPPGAAFAYLGSRLVLWVLVRPAGREFWL